VVKLPVASMLKTFALKCVPPNAVVPIEITVTALHQPAIGIGTFCRAIR